MLSNLISYLNERHLFTYHIVEQYHAYFGYLRSSGRYSTPDRRVEATSWCLCRGRLVFFILYLVIFMAYYLSTTQAF
jgi:hypothetical protein